MFFNDHDEINLTQLIIKLFQFKYLIKNKERIIYMKDINNILLDVHVNKRSK